jgi:filamentous hemagglutinin family protein
MKQAINAVLVTVSILISTTSVEAQIVRDASLSNTSTVSSQDNMMIIEGGTQQGNNLFHSFEQFSVPNGFEVWFNNSEAIQNIFTRVTGTNLSLIDGLIKANGTANLFFINPNGIEFGTNASLDIGGSFIASTANSIRFADGYEFSATNPDSQLTLSVPVGLTLNNPASIRMQGQGHNLGGLTSPFVPVIRDPSPSGLAVKPGKTLALIGGEVSLDGGVLTADSGQIYIGSIANGFVKMGGSAQGWTFNYQDISHYNDIQVGLKSLLDASGASRGSIHVQGQNISLEDGSMFLIQNKGGQSSSLINVVASEGLSLSGEINSRFSSNILSEALSSGDGANITIRAKDITIRDGGSIRPKSYSQGRSGDLNITAANSMNVVGVAPRSPRIASSANTSNTNLGNSGNTIIITPQLNLRDAGFVGSVTLGQGDAGSVKVESDTIHIQGGIQSESSISATSFSEGNAGNIEIQTLRLFLEDDANVNAATLGFGAAGTISIQAEEFIDIKPNSGIIASVVNSTVGGEQELFGTPTQSTGASGNILIETKVLKIMGDDSQIGVSNQGLEENAGILSIKADSIILENRARLNANAKFGAGGNIFITTKDFLITQKSRVSATSVGVGNGGNILIDADNLSIFEDGVISAESIQGFGGNIKLEGGNVLVQFGQIRASTQTGSGGNISTNLQQLKLENDSLIEASVEDSGIGGTLNIVSNVVSLNNQSQIKATSQSGSGGNINFETSTLKLLDNSQITTSVQDGDGGNINFTSEFLFLLDKTKVIANAFTGNGGNISITAQEIFRSPDNIISASSELGIDGTIRMNITPNEVNPQPLKVSLRESEEETDPVEVCNQVNTRFSVQGSGGSLPSPSSQLETYTIEDLIPYGQAVSLQQNDQGDWELLSCNDLKQ